MHTNKYAHERKPREREADLAYVSIRQHTSVYVSIRQHTSVYVSIRQHRDRAGDLGGGQDNLSVFVYLQPY
jgi:hypothetical protein